MTTVLNGLLGGLIAGAAATAAAGLVARESSDDTAALGGVAASRWGRAALGLLYGSVGGGALVALELFVLGALGVPPTVGEALGVALAWSGALFLTAVAVRRAVRDGGLDRTAAGSGLLAYHLAYGACLGVWIRLTWIT